MAHGGVDPHERLGLVVQDMASAVRQGDDGWLSIPNEPEWPRQRADVIRDRRRATLFGVLKGTALQRLLSVVATLPIDLPGVRLRHVGEFASDLSAAGDIGAIAASAIGQDARPVRAVLFDKTEAMNWKLGWHQDRTIVVASRTDVAGFGPWTTKAGLQHVAPPFDLLERMVTLRIHVDPVEQDNAPLQIALGSHRLGLVPQPKIQDAVARCETMACLAEVGDVWMYSTAILHASDAAAAPRRRRVLQIDYAAFDLPGGLEWIGV